MPIDSSQEFPSLLATADLSPTLSQHRNPIDAQEKRRRRAEQQIPMLQMNRVFEDWKAVTPDPPMTSDRALDPYQEDCDNTDDTSQPLRSAPIARRKRIHFNSEASQDSERLPTSSSIVDQDNCSHDSMSSPRKLLDNFFSRRKSVASKENTNVLDTDLKRKKSRSFFKKASRSKSSPDLATLAQLSKVNGNYYVPPASVAEKIRTQPPPLPTRPVRPPRPPTLYFDADDVLFSPPGGAERDQRANVTTSPRSPIPYSFSPPAPIIRDAS